MLKLGGKSIGTPVRCPFCRHPNLAIDIRCQHCGGPLDWKKADVAPPAVRREGPAEAPQAAPQIPVLHAVPAAPSQSANSRPWPPSAVKRTETPERPAPEPSAPAAGSQFCWSCGARNLGNASFCSRCGAALGTRPSPQPTAAVRRPRRRRRWALSELSLPTIELPTIELPRLSFPRWTMPSFAATRQRLRAIPRIAWIVAIALAVLLIVPLAYVLLPSGRTLGERQLTTSHSPTTAASGVKPGSPEAVAIAGVEAKTGLKYSSKCSGTVACLSLIGQTRGQNAAAYLFSTAHTGGRECAGYVYEKGGWHLLGSLCGLPGQVTPMTGRDAKVHVPRSCANVRNAASLQARVVTCIYDGTTVRVDGGPTYADSLMWWHINTGWMAHDFLVAP